MGISQSAIGALYLYALLLGIALGAIYDCLRITRVFLGNHYSHRTARRLREIHLPLLSKGKTRGESRFLGLVVFFEDLFFCLFAGISLILLLYEANNGKFRFPVVLSAGCGFLLYRGTVGRLVMLFSEVIAFALETSMRYCVFFLLFPFRWTGKRLLGFFRRISERIARKRQKKIRIRYTKREIDRISVNGCGMLTPDQPSSVSRGNLKKGK